MINLSVFFNNYFSYFDLDTVLKKKKAEPKRPAFFPGAHRVQMPLTIQYNMI